MSTQIGRDRGGLYASGGVVNRGLIDGRNSLRPNEYSGTCINCRGHVNAKAGYIQWDDMAMRWNVFHATPYQCRAYAEDTFMRGYTYRVDPALNAHKIDLLASKQFSEETIRDLLSVPTNKEQTAMTLYEYAVLYTPVDDDGKALTKQTRVLVEPTTTLSTSQASVERHALVAVELADGEDIDNVKVLVRPFI
jgi:hypothetical protein